MMDPVSDHELLRRFAEHRDESAFQILVERHLPSERAVNRSQELAKSLQLDAAQRNAVFAELMTRKAEDPERIKTLLNKIQAQDYNK